MQQDTNGQPAAPSTHVEQHPSANVKKISNKAAYGPLMVAISLFVLAILAWLNTSISSNTDNRNRVTVQGQAIQSPQSRNTSSEDPGILLVQYICSFLVFGAALTGAVLTGKLANCFSRKSLWLVFPIVIILALILSGLTVDLVLSIIAATSGGKPPFQYIHPIFILGVIALTFAALSAFLLQVRAIGCATEIKYVPVATLMLISLLLISIVLPFYYGGQMSAAPSKNEVARLASQSRLAISGAFGIFIIGFVVLSANLIGPLQSSIQKLTGRSGQN